MCTCDVGGCDVGVCDVVCVSNVGVCECDAQDENKIKLPIGLKSSTLIATTLHG